MSGRESVAVKAVHGRVKVPIYGHSKCPTPDLT